MKIKSLFIRFPNQRKVDQRYIDNCMQSLHKVFVPYVESSKSHTLTDFRNMLKRQHKVLVSNNYYGYTHCQKNLKLPSNRMRDELKVELHKPILKRAWYSKELKNYNLRNKKEIVPDVGGIRPYARPKILNLKEGLKLYLPEAKYLNKYLELMHIMLECILADMGDTDLLLERLGCYIHLGVIAHPFEKVNFSLIMAQVNYLLMVHKFKGISHGYLDFKCFLNDTETIIKEFKKMVQRANNEK